MKILALILAILLLPSFAFSWTSSTHRFQSYSRSPRGQYTDNKRVQGNMSTAARSMRNYNREVRLGPSQTLIRSRIVIPVDLQRRYKEIQRKCQTLTHNSSFNSRSK